MVRRMVAVLALVILGSVAAQELYAALTPLIPWLLIGALAFLLVGGWVQYRRRP